MPCEGGWRLCRAPTTCPSPSTGTEGWGSGWPPDLETAAVDLRIGLRLEASSLREELMDGILSRETEGTSALVMTLTMRSYYNHIR